MAEPLETIETDMPVVACDGGKGPLGHPRVFMNLAEHGEIVCPYCSRHYVLKRGTATAAAH